MEHAAYIGAEYLFERPFDRDAAEVQNRIHAFDQVMHCGFVCQVADLDFFVFASGWRHVGNIGNA
ncbi:hypothetical protein D3C84_1291910 [compost metagenome]